MEEEQSKKIRTRVPKSILCENWHWCQFWHWILALVPIGIGANFGIGFWHWCQFWHIANFMCTKSPLSFLVDFLIFFSHFFFLVSSPDYSGTYDRKGQ